MVGGDLQFSIVISAVHHWPLKSVLQTLRETWSILLSSLDALSKQADHRKRNLKNTTKPKHIAQTLKENNAQSCQHVAAQTLLSCGGPPKVRIKHKVTA